MQLIDKSFSNLKQRIKNIAIFIGIAYLYILCLMPIAELGVSGQKSNLRTQLEMIALTILLAGVYGLFLKLIWNKLPRVTFNAYISNHKKVITFTLIILYILVFIISGFIHTDKNASSIENLQQVAAFPSIFETVILAPIFEELVFRGLFFKIFFHDLTKKSNVILGVLISSLLFGLMHNPVLNLTVIPYFIAGLLLSLVYLSTQKLQYSIAIHMLNNLIAFIL